MAMVLPDRDGLGVPMMPNMVSLIAERAASASKGSRLIDYLLSADVERQLAQSEAVQIPLHAGVPGPKHIPAIGTLQADDARLRQGGQPGRGRDRSPGAAFSDSERTASRMWHWRSSRTPVVGTAILVFGLCSLLPSLYVLVTALGDVDGLSALLLDARQRRLLLPRPPSASAAPRSPPPPECHSARFWRRTHLAGARRDTRRSCTAPVLLPPYVVALAWTYLAGHSGWMSGLPGAAIVLGLVLYPIPMLATEVALSPRGRAPRRGWSVRRRRRQVLRRITLPLVAPPILAASLVVFVLAISDFAVPGLLGVRVYTTEIFTAFAALYDFPRAMVLALPLLLLCVGIGSLASLLMHATPTVGRRPAGAASSLLGVPTVAAAAVVLVVAVAALALPVAILVNEARGVRSWSMVVDGSAAAMWNSLLLAGAGATLVVRSRRRSRLCRCPHLTTGCEDAGHPARHRVCHTQHDCRRRPDCPVESSGADRRHLRHRVDARAGVRGALPAGGSPGDGSGHAACARVARRGRGRERRRLVEIHLARRPAAGSPRHGGHMDPDLHPRLRRAGRQPARRPAGRIDPADPRLHADRQCATRPRWLRSR